MKNMMNGSYIYNDETYDFNFYTDLSAYDKLLFVNSVTDLLVDGSHYNHIIRDLIFDFNIIDVFTDIDTSFANEKDDDGDDINSIILIDRFLEVSNVVDIVKANIDDDLIDELNNAIDLNIQYLTGIHPSPLNNALAKLVDSLDRKVSGLDIDSMMNVAGMFANMTDDFTTENIVNAYINSDMHKENIDEVKKAKRTKKSKK